MPLIQPFIIQPDPHAIRQHPTLTRQVRELSEAYEDGSITVDDKRLQLVGSLLWEVLSLGKQLGLAKEQAGNNILPIIIESDDGLVISLPWETLHHSDYGFLARQPGFTLTRRMPKGKKSLPEPECAPLRVLLFTSLPDDLSEHARLQIEDEQAAVLQTLAAAEQEGRVQLKMPDDGRFDSFKTTLQNFKPHVVYFSGHGKFDYEHHNTKAWAIFQFEDEWGKTLEVEENDIRDCLMDSGIQAVVLSACESAKSHKDYADNGLAQCLHVAGIPHVIGMRESVYDIAGIEFAKEFLAALSQSQSMDQALQQARLAIQAMPKHRNTDEHWCLPAQFSQDLNQPLVDWSSEPEARGQMQSTRESVNGISLPPKFIGRRRELREWQNALRDGSKSECLIIGAGGMGKTALAGKLLDSLKRDGYEVFGLSVRPNEEHDWRRSLSELEQLLKDEFLIKQYQTALGEATTIETPDDLDEPTKVTVDECKRAEALLDGLLRQYDGQFALLFDNLESVQDEKNRQVNDPVLADWIEVARGFSDRGLKFVLTSRWHLPEWGEGSLCVLGQPVFADYVAFIRELNLPMRFIGNGERVRAAFEKLGGNYRALTFFAAAAQGMTLGAEQEFLEKLGQAQEEIQVDMAIEQVYEQLDESQREVLNLMRVYLYPVDMEGIRQIALPEYEGVEETIVALLEVSLLEKYWHDITKKYEYILSPIVLNYLLDLKIEEPKSEKKQKGATYFLDRTPIRGHENDWLEYRSTTQIMLFRSGLIEESYKFTLFEIIGVLEALNQNNSLIFYGKSILESQNLEVKFIALNKLAISYSNIGEADIAIYYLNRAKELLELDGKKNWARLLQLNFGVIHIDKGGYNEAAKYFESFMQEEDEPDQLIINNEDISDLILFYKGILLFLLESYDECIQFLSSFVAKTHDDMRKILALTNLANAYTEIYDYSAAIETSIQALSTAQAKGLKIAEGIALHNLSEIYYLKSDYDIALDYSMKGFDFNGRIGSYTFQSSCALSAGRIHSLLGSDDKAEHYFLIALNIQKNINYTRGECLTCLELTKLYAEKGDYEKSMEKNKLAKKLNKSIKSKRFQGVISLDFVSLALVDDAINKDDLVKEINKSINIFKEIDDKLRLSQAYDVLSQIYKKHLNSEQSIHYLKLASNLQENIFDYYNLVNTSTRLADSYVETKDFSKAIDLYKKAMDVNNSLKIPHSNNYFISQIGTLYFYMKNDILATKNWLKLHAEARNNSDVEMINEMSDFSRILGFESSHWERLLDKYEKGSAHDFDDEIKCELGKRRVISKIKVYFNRFF